MTNNTLARLTKIADRLDYAGKENLADLVDETVRNLTKHADEIDELIKKMEDKPFEPKLKDEFELSLRGKSDKERADLQHKELMRRMDERDEQEPTKEELDAFMGEEEDGEQIVKDELQAFKAYE